jgi:hypothetical protein
VWSAETWQALAFALGLVTIVFLLARYVLPGRPAPDDDDAERILRLEEALDEWRERAIAAEARAAEAERRERDAERRCLEAERAVRDGDELFATVEALRAELAKRDARSGS